VHAPRLPLPNLARVSPGVSRVDVIRAQGGDEPSSVAVWFHELKPFGLRYRFWRMVDHELPDDHPARWVWWLAGSPETVPPETDEAHEWTWRHRRDLAANAYAYERYALDALEIRPDAVSETREAMLELNDDHDPYKGTALEDIPDLYFVALTRKVAALKRDGYTIDEMAVRRFGMSREKLHRRLAEAKQRGLNRQ
jgi:hypothetical protein